MLKEIRVKDYAILGDVSVQFAHGLHVFTGETGAGKSLLAGALGLLLGQKANDNVISQGAKEAHIFGLIEVHPLSQAASWLSDHEIDLDNGEILVQRIVKAQGRSNAYLQSHPVSAQDLSEFMAMLFDMHGQHENQSLYYKENQRKILDASAGLQKDVARCQELFYQLKGQHEELKNWQENHNKLLEEQDYLDYSLQEIDDVKMQLNEREQLQAKLKSLESSEKINRGLQGFADLMSSSGGVLQKLKEAKTALINVSHLLKEEDIARFNSSMIELEDVSEVFISMKDSLSYSSEELESLNARLLILQRLEKKYGGSSEAVFRFADQARERLGRIEMGEEEKERLQAACAHTEQQLHALAKEISQKRHQHAQELQVQVQQVLHELSMPSAHFEIQVAERKRSDGKRALGTTGIDDIEFLFAANLGQPLKPLKSIASGGEASRVLLALKSVLALADEIGTLIFDEIDTGVGGNAALSVAKHMQKLAKSKQVLCITHLAVIAAHADEQICLKKKELDGNTITEVLPINDEDRIREIARMLSGTQDEIALQHAQTLLQNSRRS